jgi:hypothetical protein
MVLTAAPREEIAQLEWKRVQEMIAEVGRQERREDFARWLFRWDFAVREFRKVEQRLIILGTPSEWDWHCHADCLHSLLGAGHAIILASKGFKAEELSQFGVTHSQIEAYVADLEQSFREWHHGFAEAEISELQQAILGSAP